jgi:uncharacterized protein
MPESKTLPASVKSATDVDGDGIVEALVATYDIDSAGDRIVPGAFAESLKSWGESGNAIPFIWSHLHDDLDAYLGDVIEAKETDDGLWVRAQLDMDDDRARKAYRLLKSGRVRNYSFAYEVLDSEQQGDELLLKSLKLFEVGPTLIGMNQQTRTLAVKRSGVLVKRGRVLSAANESSLREAHDAIGRVLSQLDSQPDDDEDVDGDDESNPDRDEAPSGEPEKADERARVKADEPMRTDPADDDLAAHIDYLSRKAL